MSLFQKKSAKVIVFSLIVIVVSVIVIVVSVSAWLSYTPTEALPRLSPYPFGKNFAFTVTDDPDWHTLEKIQPVYDFLDDIGMKTTIAVWARECTRSNGMPDIEGSFDKGATLKRKPYRDYILELRRRGFEIGLHTVSGCNDMREETMQGYEDFKEIIGEYPNINIMHSNNLENIYWGPKVFTSGFLRWVFKDLIGMVYDKTRYPFGGEEPDSPYFWGDILKEKTKYVRMWGTSDINTLRFNPSMPYHDPDKPYVNYWFSFSDGYSLYFFNKLISDRNIDQLTKERGASIVYTHFQGFAKRTGDGFLKLDEYFRQQMEKISGKKDGWFVPVSVLLDRLLAMKNVTLLNNEGVLIVVNSNSYPVEGITVLVSRNSVFYDNNGNTYAANEEGEIVIETLGAAGSLTLFDRMDMGTVKNDFPGGREYKRLVLKRILMWLFAHRG